MHFPIICLSTEKHPAEDWDTNLDCQDTTLNYFTDYFGELYSAQERKEAIESDWFKMLFDGFADLDTEKEEIRVFSKDVTRRALESHACSLIDHFESKMQEVNDRHNPIWHIFYEMRANTQFYKDFWCIFVVDGCAYPSMMFIEDMPFYADMTLYIENIFDAHC